MTLILTLLSAYPYVDLPRGLVGWLGFVGLLGLVSFITWKGQPYTSPIIGRLRWLLVWLVIATPLTSLFLGLGFPIGGVLPPPGLPAEPNRATCMFFFALPWTVAAGLLGSVPSTLLALLAGIFRALWDTHHPFTLLEPALLAALMSYAFRQPYRSRIYRALRHPFVTSLGLAIGYPLFHLISLCFNAEGVLATRLDYALTNLPRASVAIGAELLIAGAVAEAIAYLFPNMWGHRGALLPSPTEKSLQLRLIASMAPLGMVLIVSLVWGDWVVAGKAAREMVKAQMASTAEMAAENIPYFLETGQNLIQKLAENPQLLSQDPAILTQVLSEEIKSVPFFNQLSVLNQDGELIASYPTSYFVGTRAPIQEQAGIKLALSGVPFQMFVVPPASAQTTAQVSFVAAIFDESRMAQNVLIGRADIGSNPFTKPILSSLNNLTNIGGQGVLLDETGRILVHPDTSMVMTLFSERIPEEAEFYDDTAPDGTRRLVYYQPAKGRPWSVVLTVPAHHAQQQALTIATPLMVMILVLSVLAVGILRLGVRFVTASLQNLASEAELIAQGKLNNPLPTSGDDEVGQLRRAFERMRASLKARLDELNRLLLVSQGVASSLDFPEAIQPVLESALAMGAKSARIVLTPSSIPELSGDTSAPLSFGMGPTQNLYGELDEQILAFTRQQGRLVLSNVTRPHLLSFTPDAPRPESLLAVSIRHENQYYGTLWIAYDKPHTFSEEEVRFLTTLGTQAALAAANSRLFLNAEVGRQRLSAILASSPDPVLVTDQQERLLLANPAAWQILGMNLETSIGQPIDQAISQRELIDLLRSSSSEKVAHEIELADGRVYHAIATPVLAEGQRVGRVCILSDVTHFKNLDRLKSEFVEMVSHDLNSPLALIRGYTTMLEIVGQLNEQQRAFTQKILSSVEDISKLVRNLLDLGRIEKGIGLQLSIVSVQDIVERVVGKFQLQATHKRIQLTSEVSQPSPVIEADADMLQQALQNLVDNAIKYNRPEGKVHVRAQLQPFGILFEVIDNGWGISPVDQGHVFEKFYRGAQQGTKQHRGTGLGLALVKSIAERHSGKVWVDSKLGKGSTFYMMIPLRHPKDL